jgi:8-oxo-dGTP pyrophosphatase MutT (NUDIX family)/transcriptional regulator with XRE-family HTH domain
VDPATLVRQTVLVPQKRPRPPGIDEWVAARVKYEREQRGWSTSELARRVSKAGVTLRQQQVWQIESGKPPRKLSVGEAAAFAKIFGISLGQLMTPPSEQTGDLASLIQLGIDFAEWRREEGALAARLFEIAGRIDELDPDEVYTATVVEKYSAVADARDEVIRDLETIVGNYRTVMESIKQHSSVWSVIASMRDLVPTTPADQGLQQPVVAAIVASAQGVLIGRRNDRTPPWGFISGEIEPGELPEDAAVREVKEETGLEVRAGKVIGERDHPATGRHMIYMAAEPTRGTEVFVGDEAELAEVRWVSLAEADELMGGQMFGPVREYLAHAESHDGHGI